MGGVRWWNVKHPAAYAQRLATSVSPAAGRETLDAETRRMEHIMLQTRIIDGLGTAELDADGRAEADAFFRSRVFPVLTPLSVDPGHPFPFISNLSTSLGLILRHPNTGEKVFARVKVPEVLPQFIKIAGESRKAPRIIKGRFGIVNGTGANNHHEAGVFPL